MQMEQKILIPLILVVLLISVAIILGYVSRKNKELL